MDIVSGSVGGREVPLAPFQASCIVSQMNRKQI